MSEAKILQFISPRSPKAFLVRVEYREPNYEPDDAPTRAPYDWTYRVTAASEEAAINESLAQFREMERLSSVGWGREVCGVHVEPAGPKSAPSVRTAALAQEEDDAPTRVHVARHSEPLEAKGSPVAPDAAKVTPKLDGKPPERGPRIRCPRCYWQPKPTDTWQCTCLHVWNTFDTRGRCPKCSFQWHVTQCLQCHAHSAHEDWYEKPERTD